jgi:hypothetical protein
MIRAAGDTHHQALRALGNRRVGILHGCLQHHSVYDETIIWGHRTEKTIRRRLKFRTGGCLGDAERNLLHAGPGAV